MSTPPISSNSIIQRPTPVMARTPSRSLSPKKDFARRDKRSSLIIPLYAQFAPSNTQQAPVREPSPEQNTEETDVLTLLAAQERRVLELKEQLAKAEDELQALRKEWATNQSTKRRNEGRRMHQMRPLSISSAKSVDPNEDQDDVWMYEEMERRKALLGNTKSSHRRVFSGSRHAKELTLLSPEKVGSDFNNSDASEEVDIRRSRDPVKKLLPRTDSLVQNIQPMLLPESRDRKASQSPQREDILKTGKQVATDLRDGLWTFFEDLRQAAVGDEPRAGQNTSSSASRPSNTAQGVVRITSNDRDESRPGTRNSSKSTDAGGEFWKGHGLPEPKNLAKSAVVKAAKTSTPRKPALHTFDSDGDAWDTWESPMSPAANTKQGVSLNHSIQSSPNTSVGSSTDVTPRPIQHEEQKQRDAIPWPSLTKIAPGRLRRTASHLMEELERSLTPPSGEKNNMDALLR